MAGQLTFASSTGQLMFDHTTGQLAFGGCIPTGPGPTHNCFVCCNPTTPAPDNVTVTWPGGVTDPGTDGGCAVCQALPAGVYNLGPEQNESAGCFWGYKSACFDCQQVADTGVIFPCAPFGDYTCPGTGGNAGYFGASLLYNFSTGCDITLQVDLVTCSGATGTGGSVGYSVASATYKTTRTLPTNGDCTTGTYTLHLQAGSFLTEGAGFPFCSGAWPATCTITL